jgi:hypothetical protein
VLFTLNKKKTPAMIKKKMTAPIIPPLLFFFSGAYSLAGYFPRDKSDKI